MIESKQFKSMLWFVHRHIVLLSLKSGPNYLILLALNFPISMAVFKDDKVKKKKKKKGKKKRENITFDLLMQSFLFLCYFLFFLCIQESVRDKSLNMHRKLKKTLMEYLNCFCLNFFFFFFFPFFFFFFS